ncbi:MAG: tetratricopeptide repeat protein [bacterium]|nr:tetratricopeptide repeat protein [bacterium]
MVSKIVRFFILLFLFVPGACTQSASKQDDLTQSAQKADSLSIKLNSPELKAINAQLLATPGEAALYEKRARVYLGLHEFNEAINDSKRAIKLDSTQANFYLTLADVYFAQNSTRLSKELLEITAKKFPNNTEALLKLAELYYLVQRYQEGIDFVNKALRINENLAKAYFIKGSIYRESGDTNRAISSLQTAIEQDSKMEDAHYDLGVLFAAKKNPLALDYYANVLRLNPSNAKALYARAKLLQDLKKTDEAIKAYEDIIATNKTCDNCQYNLGAIYLEFKKDPKKALEHFTKAIEINNNFVAAYYARAYTYTLLHDRVSAKADFAMCLRLSPNYEPAIQGLNAL